ncbi:hypothetical protein LINPERHAP2_LOCUS4986 [Linum perenne]
MGDKLHRREENSLDHQLKPLNDRSVIKEMNGAKRSTEAVGCKNALVGERSSYDLIKFNHTRFPALGEIIFLVNIPNFPSTRVFECKDSLQVIKFFDI